MDRGTITVAAAVAASPNAQLARPLAVNVMVTSTAADLPSIPLNTHFSDETGEQRCVGRHQRTAFVAVGQRIVEISHDGNAAPSTASTNSTTKESRHLLFSFTYPAGAGCVDTGQFPKGSAAPCGWTVFTGSTIRSNSTSVTNPSLRAACFSVGSCSSAYGRLPTPCRSR